MNATTATQEHNCSCGRSFSNELSLKRHRWVTGHVEIANSAEVAAPAPEAFQTQAVHAELAYLQAVEALRAKRLEQERYENQTQVQDFVAWAGESVCQGAMQTAAIARAATASGLSALRQLVRVMMVMLALLGLAAAGLGAGNLIASSSGGGIATSHTSAWTTSQS